MSAHEVDAAVSRAEARRPDLAMAVQAMADALTAGEGTEMIHQAALQEFLWWYLPRQYPEENWTGLAEAAAELLDELGMALLAGIARSQQTAEVLVAWATGAQAGAAAFRRARGSSGLEPPDTSLLAWGSVMGSDESRALDAVERALGDAVATGELVPGGSRWRATAVTITEKVLTRPFDIPSGQNLAGLVTTERIGHWIDSARHPMLGEWRSWAANRLLNPIEAPTDPAGVIAPVHWLLELAGAPGGAELTRSNYLARATVLAAVERFGWWDWPKAPRSEADVPQLSTVRHAAARLRLVRRRGGRLHLTTRGSQLVAEPAALWRVVASETEDGEELTCAVAELVGLRLLRGRVEWEELVDDVGPILDAQGWRTDGGPITSDHVWYVIGRPLRWWRLLSALDEVDATWERGTGRRLTSHSVALSPDGERITLAYLRSRATGPRHSVYG